ncbi:hypothetical protein [Undibacterium sp. Tian12W]|uniref:hypothetical protein n=1 Tax=Undibacterium sp. Tian12W TaxID=3413054 RepID=UPI003BF2C848
MQIGGFFGLKKYGPFEWKIPGCFGANTHDVQLLGLKACSLQEYSNQMDAVLGAQKALYYGPTMSALDTANSMISKSPKDYCAEAVNIAVETCSQGGFYLDNKYKKKLLELSTK